MTAAVSQASDVVSRLFTSSPISILSLVKRTNGTSAKGMPKDRTTCETIRARLGSIPMANTVMAGIRVIRRRSMSGILRCNSPSMIIAPAYAPTEVDASPEARSPSANSNATTCPQGVGDRRMRSVDRIDPSRPRKVVAATSSMDRLTAPASSIARPTSIFVTRNSRDRIGPPSG